MTRFVLTAFFMAFCAFQVSAAEPRLLAFVAGIENYQDAELDKLEFAADDARKIFERLGVIANLSDKSELHVADDQDGSRLNVQQLRNALSLFARKIDHEDTVLVYLGGHGTLSSRSNDLWILPSDYDRQAELNYMEYDEIKDILTKEVEQRNLAKVKIVLLVNVCGAGNAVEDGATEMSVPIEDKYIQQAVNWISEFRVGQADLAVIPATPRGRNTFEKDGSSIFARHLIEAFDGAAAGPDDQLTTGEIFAYLKTALGEDLPRNPEFANDIVVGETSRARGRDHLVLGTALMGAARAIQDPDIARILQDLASFHFDEVRGRNPELAARARLRKLQVGVLAQSITDVAAKAKEIPKNALTQVERGELQTLLEVGSSLRYPTFADYLADLEADPNARVLILRPSLTMASDVDVEGLLKLRFGQEKVYAGDISDLSGLTDFLATLTTDTPPLVVYSGSEGGAGCSVVEEKCQFAHPWETILASLRESNGGPFVFVFSAPFGGALAEIAPKDIMLYLPASQRNGMLWRGADESSAGILFEGIADRFSDAQLAENLRSFHSSFSNSEFAPGEPMWRQGGVDPRPAIVKSLAPLDELSLLSSLGCLDLDLPSCASRETLTGSRLFDALEAAASADMKGDMPDARSGYLSVHNAIDALPDGVEALGAVKVRADFEDLATVIGARLSDFLGPGDRNFVIVPIGVEDYLSPLIGDVPHALNDLAVYSDRLTMTIQRSAGNGEATINQIKVLPTFEPRTAQALRDHLKKVAAMTVDRPNDVVVLLFSGRGDEEDGRRFLVTSAQEYIPSDPDLVDFSDIGRRLRDPLGHRFDLSEVASIFHDHWLLSIYDTQFARPVLSRRRDVILEKQLYSAYPLTSANAAQTQRESSVVPANLLTQRQVHLWVDGRITQAMTTRQTCGPGVEVAAVASPLAAGILRALDGFKGGTYREFMQTLQADDCARSDRLPGSLVMQGDVDLPMFASGDGARFVQYFKSGQARRAAALRAASLVADDMLARYTEPEMVLTGLALDLANAHFSNGSPHLPGLPFKDWQAQAKSRILQVTQLEQSLKPIFWETRSRISAEAGELEQAREILRNAPPSILSQRHLAELLVEFAERSLRAQPLEILAKVDDKLKDSGSMRFDEFRIASRRLQTLIRAEQARLSEGYSIQE